MQQDGRAIANFILDTCDQLGAPVTQLALQKLVYFCHAWHLVEFGQPLIKQQFEAWEYGPVLPYLYSDFRKFGKLAITDRSKKMNRFTGEKEVASAQLSPETKAFLEKVIAFYSRLSASQLVELSHCEGGPWEEVWAHSGKINPGMRIDNANIKRYYSTLPRAAKVQ